MELHRVYRLFKLLYGVLTFVNLLPRIGDAKETSTQCAQQFDLSAEEILRLIDQDTGVLPLDAASGDLELQGVYEDAA